MSGDLASERHRTLPVGHVLLLLALPVALTIVLPDWLYSLPDNIDAWVYNGFFRNVEAYTSTMFPDTYYGTRLGWILPGYLAYASFEAGTANAVLHVTFYLVAVLSLYWIVSAAAGSSAALVAAFAFALHLPVIRAIGSDYVDGPIIAYALLSTALLMRALRAPSAWAGVFAGIASGAMLHSNVGAVFLVPSVLIWISPLSRERSAWRHAAWHLWNWCLGVAVCTLALAQFSLTHGGTWLFFMPSFSWMARMGAANPWDVSGIAWVSSAPWVFVPIGVGVAAALVPLVRWRRTKPSELQVKAVAAFVVTLLIFAVWDFVGPGAVLYWPFYTSWLSPSAFVMIGVVLIGSAQPMRARYMVLLVLSAALLASIVRPAWLQWSISGWLVLAASVALMIIAAVSRSATVSALVIGSALACVHTGFPGYYGPTPDRRDAFHAIDRGVRFIQRFETGEAPRFLLAASGRVRYVIEGLTSVYLWEYTIVSRDFPKMTPQQASLIVPGMVVVVISEQPSMAATFDELFATYGLRGRLLGSERVDTRHGPFYLTVVQTARASAPL